MFDDPRVGARERAILTETLPYEVPVIFSNDRFFRTRARRGGSAAVTTALKRLERDPGARTIPYTYEIKKGRDDTNTMSIMHPLWQVKIANLYHDYATTILISCARSEFSLRRPVNIAPHHSAGITVDTDSKYKSGLVALESSLAETPDSHIGSYFEYGKYNLLAKFIDSREYLRLEKRFSKLRTMDVSRCFNSIYTHTIAWAVKEKAYAKTNADFYSFESLFDKLMQGASWGETNGIPIGPEISRIFAEIIFQRVDHDVLLSLSGRNLEHNVDYAIRRYVDDYYVFANSEHDLDRISHEISTKLGQFKLFLNEKKTITHSRPFVSGITQAKSEIRKEFRELRAALTEANSDNPAFRVSLGRLRAEIRGLRIVLSKYDVHASAVTGTILPIIRRITASIVAGYEKHDAAFQRALIDTIISLLELTFYLCALDPRVRPAYTLCQIVMTVQQAGFMEEAHNKDRINHVIVEEASALVRSMRRDALARDMHDCIELFNLLICGATFVGADFLQNKIVSTVLKEMAHAEKLTYFTYITTKYCMLRDAGRFRDELSVLNKAAKKKIVDNKGAIESDAEIYLLLHDYISAPDISVVDKRKVFNQLVSTHAAASVPAVEGLSRLLGFVDWDGISVVHLLERKRLRQPYAPA